MLRVPATMYNSHICVGDVLKGDNGKLYIMLKRDPWSIYVCRYYWWDELFNKILSVFMRRKGDNGSNK
jgi:hypothetical protein